MKTLFPLFVCAAFLLLAASGCGRGPSPTAPSAAPEGTSQPLELTSAAFGSGEAIPAKYTCDGEDISPPLAWGDPPQGTGSFALIMDDPDAPAGTWVHWVLYDLPAESRTLPEASPPDGDLPDGGQHGGNSWRRLGYGGPCPPSGTHRYFFRLYALDVVLDLDAGATKKELSQAMEGHVLAEGQLMGTYTRQ
jgi:Raf kinase inhibitor-like YbhB/YbcL family protein